MNKPKELWFTEYTNNDQSFGVGIELDLCFLFGVATSRSDLWFEASIWFGPISINTFYVRSTR